MPGIARPAGVYSSASRVPDSRVTHLIVPEFLNVCRMRWIQKYPCLTDVKFVTQAWLCDAVLACALKKQLPCVIFPQLSRRADQLYTKTQSFENVLPMLNQIQRSVPVNLCRIILDFVDDQTSRCPCGDSIFTTPRRPWATATDVCDIKECSNFQHRQKCSKTHEQIPILFCEKCFCEDEEEFPLQCPICTRWSYYEGSDMWTCDKCQLSFHSDCQVPFWHSFSKWKTADLCKACHGEFTDCAECMEDYRPRGTRGWLEVPGVSAESDTVPDPQTNKTKLVVVLSQSRRPYTELLIDAA